MPSVRFLRLLSLLAIAGLLAGCIPPVPYPSRVTPDATAAPTRQPPVATRLVPTPTLTPYPDWWVEPAQLRNVNITFWHPWTGEVAEEVASLAYDFNKNNSHGIMVTARGMGGNAALAEEVESGIPLPELVIAQPEQISAWQGEIAAFVDLNLYRSDPTWALPTDAFYDVFESSPEGEQISLPAERSARVLFYNLTWAKELGFSQPPKTPAQFQEQACAAAAALNADRFYENNGTGGWLWELDSLTVLSWLAAFDAHPEVPVDGTYQFQTENAAAGFSFLRTLLDGGCAWANKTLSTYEIFASRRALFFSGSLQDIPALKIAMPYLKSADAWTVIPYPAADGDQVVLTSGVDFAIPQSEPARQLAAWMFMRWLLEPQQQARLIRAGGTYPLSEHALSGLDAYSRQNAQWETALAWIPESQPAPADARWRTVRSLLQDAAWQIAQPYVKLEDIPDVLTQLDEMILQLSP